MINGPFVTQLLDFQLSFYGAIVMAAIFGTSILRDFQRDTYQIVFTKPIGKFAYLGGRWAGSLLITLFIFTGIPLGEMLGASAPWVDHTRLAPLNLGMLAYHYSVIVAPQVFFLGSVFFLVAALTRRVFVVYLQGVTLFAVYLIGLIAVQQTRSLNPYWPSVFRSRRVIVVPQHRPLLDRIRTKHALDSLQRHVSLEPGCVVLGGIDCVAGGLLIFSHVSGGVDGEAQP